MTHFFAEALAMCQEAASRKAVVQVGSQQRSDPLFRQAVEIVRNGHLGAIKRVEVGLPGGYEKPMGDATISEAPANLDYELWCGPAPTAVHAGPSSPLVARQPGLWRRNADGLDRPSQRHCLLGARRRWSGAHARGSDGLDAAQDRHLQRQSISASSANIRAGSS